MEPTTIAFVALLCTVAGLVWKGVSFMAEIKLHMSKSAALIEMIPLLHYRTSVIEKHLGLPAPQYNGKQP